MWVSFRCDLDLPFLLYENIGFSLKLVYSLFFMFGRLACEDSDLDSSRDTSSDGSIDHDLGKSFNFSREQWDHPHLACENMLKMRKTSLTDEHKMVQEGFLSDDGDAGYPRSSLLFQFLEQDLPYQRVPLADKVSWFLLGSFSNYTVSYFAILRTILVY